MAVVMASLRQPTLTPSSSHQSPLERVIQVNFISDIQSLLDVPRQTRKFKHSGDLNSELVGYSDHRDLFNHQMVFYLDARYHCS